MRYYIFSTDSNNKINIIIYHCKFIITIAVIYNIFSSSANKIVYQFVQFVKYSPP